jgi:hypothetical protein
MKKLILFWVFVGILLFGKNAIAQSPINYGEYFWDTDPGLGLATSLGSINTTNLDLLTNVSTVGLSAGNHVLNIRVRDANGIWSQLFKKTLLISPETYNPGTDPQDIRVFEYQWDSQTPVQATVSGIVNFEFIRTIPTTSLGEGNHILSIRLKDAYGFWSRTYQYSVFVLDNAPGDNISRIEYFIGNMDGPAYGSATSVSFSPSAATDVTAEFEPTTTGLTNGENLITVRIKDAQNRWSGSYQKMFNLDPSFSMVAGGTQNTSNAAQSEFCLGGSIRVPITKTGTFPAGNQFVLELSNSSGTNFTPIPTTINLAGDALTGTLPSNITPSAGYRIRAVSTLPLIRTPSATILTIGNTATASATTPTLCEGQNLQLNSSAFVTSTYAWTGPSTFTSSLQNPTRNTIPANGGGVYSVTVTSLIAGCTAIATASVTVKPLPTVTPTTPISICAGTALNLGVNANAGGTYAWTGPNTFSSTLQNPNVSNAATTSISGAYSITVTLNGCSQSNTSTVTVKPLPTVTPVTPVSVCEGSQLLLNINNTPGATYAWTGPGGFFNNFWIPVVSNSTTPSMAGTYSVTVTLNGCSASNTIAVTVKPLPTVTPTTPITICANTALNLGVNATAGGTYVWTGPNSFSSSLQNPNVSNAATAGMLGTYSITVTLNGCSRSNTAQVNIGLVTPTLAITNQITPSGTVNLTLPAVTTGSSLPGGTVLSYHTNQAGTITLNNPNAVASEGTYYIKATAVGCTDIKPVIVNICNTSYNLVSTANDQSSGTDIKISATAITAVNKLTGTAKATYKSAGSITLNAGFLANSGTVFFADIGGCSY